MGMFDSFQLETKCPYCGEVKEHELQTKLFTCIMDTWRKGDTFSPRGLKIKDAIISGACSICYSKKCSKTKKIAGELSYREGKYFYCDVAIQDGVVHGVTKTYKDEQE